MRVFDRPIVPPIRGEGVVAILTHNRRELLSKQLEACTRDQDGARVLVADNASTDGTAEMLRRDWPEVIHLRHESNVGDVGNFIRILEVVEAEYLLVTHDDDVIDAGYFGRAKRALRAKANAVALGCNVRHIDDDDTVVQARLYETQEDRWFEEGEFVLEYLRSGLWIPCSTMVIRATPESRTALMAKESIGDDRLGGHRDVFAFCQLNRLGAVGLLGEVCASYRQHGNQASKSDDFVSASSELYRAILALWSDRDDVLCATRARMVGADLERRLSAGRMARLDDVLSWACQTVSQADAMYLSVLAKHAPLVLVAAAYGGFDCTTCSVSLEELATNASPDDDRWCWFVARATGGETPMARLRGRGAKRVAIFGAMTVGWLLVADAIWSGLHVETLLDSNRSRQGVGLGGLPIEDPTWLEVRFGVIDAVVSSSERNRSSEMALRVAQLCVEHERPPLFWWWRWFSTRQTESPK